MDITLLVSGRAILEKIKTKLLGGNPIVNDQVLHATEAWFSRDIPEIEDYLLDGPSRFWRVIEKSL